MSLVPKTVNSEDFSMVCLEMSLFPPEQHVGSLLAGQATPCLEAADSRGGAFGNDFIRGANCA